MIGLLKKRKLRKQLKEHLHAARHARHMREDIADPLDLAALAEAEEAVRSIRETGEGDIEKAVDKLVAATDKIYPSSNRTGIRENVEVIIVALAAAMAIRAFFFQPFKIPTGSMQPTLNGITTEARAGATVLDRQPLKFFKWLITGTSYKEYRAAASGATGDRLYGDRDKIVLDIGGVPHKFPAYMRNELMGKVYRAETSGATSDRLYPDRDKIVLEIGGVPHKFPSDMRDELIGKIKPFYNKGDIIASAKAKIKPYYSKGDIIASATVIAGDHILVNKMKYNFMRPERGDISVFDTRNVYHEQVRPDTFYIKRMVGLSGEKIQIQNRRLVADGKVVDDPPIFKKIANDPIYSGGHDIAPGSLLDSEDAFIQLADNEYLMVGDNTQPNMSLDGRFFGGVPREDFQGPAMFVYWPFREHWGIIR